MPRYLQTSLKFQQKAARREERQYSLTDNRFNLATTAALSLSDAIMYIKDTGQDIIVQGSEVFQ